jgi:hypothetical protein
MVIFAFTSGAPVAATPEMVPEELEEDDDPPPPHPNKTNVEQVARRSKRALGYKFFNLLNKNTP